MRFIASVILAAFSISAFAQNLSSGMDTVIVHENRIQFPIPEDNRNISIITADDIRNLPAKTINELLAAVAGIDMQQRGPFGAQADISMDGSSFDEILVLVNGVKMSDPQTGHHLMNLPVPLSAIDHIEIIHGPAARIYGVNALAGAINIVTRQPSHNEAAAMIYGGSSFENDTSNGETYYNAGAQIGLQFTHKNFGETIGISHDRGNGYRYNTAFESTRLFYSNRIQAGSSHTIEAMGGYIYNRFGASLFYAAPYDNEAVETVQTALGSILWQYKAGPHLTIAPRISYRYNKDDYIFLRDDPEYYHNIHETNVLTAELQATYQSEYGTIGLGAEWRKEMINSTNLAKHDRQNLGFYAEYRKQWKRLSMSGGFYLDRNSDWGTEFLPGIELGYRIRDHWKAFANAGTGQRLPTYTDLYYNGPSNIGNDQLKPEHSQYASAGLKWGIKNFSADASVFYRHTTDFIDWVKADTAVSWQPQNFQTLHTTGFTWSLEDVLDQQLSLPHWLQAKIRLSYTYLNQDAEADPETITKYNITALRHQFTGKLELTVLSGFTIGFQSRYLYRINGNDYTILDLRLAYQQKRWRVFSDINNITDTRYKEIGQVPLPGTWISVGLSLLFR